MLENAPTDPNLQRSVLLAIASIQPFGMPLGNETPPNSAALTEGGGGAADSGETGRKLTRAEQLEQWKKNRKSGSGVKSSPHTTAAHDRQRSLQGLSSSQVNQRTGSALSAGGSFSAPQAKSTISVRRESGRWSVGGSSAKKAGCPSPSIPLETSPQSDHVTGQAVALFHDPAHDTAAHVESEGRKSEVLVGKDNSSRGVEAPITAAAAAQSTNPMHDRRFSVHVAADDDDDEVEWRVSVSTDNTSQSLIDSNRAAQECVEPSDACTTAASEHPAQAGAAETANSMKAKGEIGGEEDEDLMPQFPRQAVPEAESDKTKAGLACSEHHQSTVETPPTGTSSNPLLNNHGRSSMHPLHADPCHGLVAPCPGTVLRDGGEAEGEGNRGVMASVSLTQEEYDAPLDELLLGTRQDKVHDAALTWGIAGAGAGDETSGFADSGIGTMQVIAETYDEDMLEDQDKVEDEATFFELRTKLFDTTSRLAKCTALLQRMVEENSELHKELEEMRGYKTKCASLQKSLEHVGSLYPLAGLQDATGTATSAVASDSATQGSSDDGSKANSKRPADDAPCAHSPTVEPPASKRSRSSSPVGVKGSMNEALEVVEEAGVDAPVEMRLKAMRTQAEERAHEVVRLRRLLQAREEEFSSERKQLVGKLMASDQARREAEAALETNDGMWKLLVENQMAAVQAKLAAMQQQPETSPTQTQESCAGHDADNMVGEEALSVMGGGAASHVGEEEQPVIPTTQECEDRTSKTSSPADKRASRRKSIIAPPAADCLQ